MVCFRNDLDVNDFKYPKPFKLTRHVEDFLLNDEEMVKNLYVERPDTYYNGVEDNQYSNKSIRLGIVNKGGQGERIYSTKGIAITLSAYGGGVFAKTGGYLINGKQESCIPVNVLELWVILILIKSARVQTRHISNLVIQ